MPVSKPHKLNRVGIAVIAKEKNDELEGMTETAYNRFADGSRAEKREIKVDPETANAILRAFPQETK